MLFRMLLNMLVLCSVLFCLSDASPPKAESSHREKVSLRGRKPLPQYTIEEENFVFSQVAASTDPYSLPTWAAIALALKEERGRGTKGFVADRTRHALRRHFFRSMVKKDEQNRYSDRVPEAVKKALRTNKYTQEEDDLIIRELLVRKTTDFNSRKLWKEIKSIHDQLQGSNTPGFVKKRTQCALRKHFNDYLKPYFVGSISGQSECSQNTLETKQGGSPKDTSFQEKNQSSEEEFVQESEEDAIHESEEEAIHETEEAIPESEEETDEDLVEIAEAMLALK